MSSGESESRNDAENMCLEFFEEQDNTMICTLPVGHKGLHEEESGRIESGMDGHTTETSPAPYTPAEISRQLERQGFLQHERTVNKLALYFRKHYQREMREGRHQGMTMDQCAIHYLQRERAVPGWIKEWCLRLRSKTK